MGKRFTYDDIIESNKQVMEKLRVIENSNKELTKKKKSQKIFSGLYTGIPAGLVSGLITFFLIIFVINPLMLYLDESQKIKGIAFEIATETGTYEFAEYHTINNFTGYNYNREAWTKDITLNIIFKDDTISLINYTTNFPEGIIKTTNNSITFVWEEISARKGVIPGHLYLNFEVHRVRLEPGPVVPIPENRPIVTINIEGHGEIDVDDALFF